MAGKQERQRKLARERHQRRMAREAERQANARKMAKIVGSSVAIVVIGAVVVVGVIALTHNKSTAKPISAPTTTTPAATPSASTPTATPVAEPAHSCTYLPAAPAVRKVGYPPSKPDYKATYQATINTNRGAIVIDLLNSKATCTVNSFVFLAQKGFYNNTPCPRLVPAGIYVLQCGDPTGKGTGGPGYAFASENLTGATYPAGTMAMANSGTPDSNGSQFFLVFRNTSLSPSYTPFGKIVAGLSLLRQIAKEGIVPPMNPAGGGHPRHEVTIESVTIKKT